MKSWSSFFSLGFAVVFQALAQSPEPLPAPSSVALRSAGFSAIERGAHFTRWSRQGWRTNLDRTVSVVTNGIVQLATGLNRQNGTNWIESQPELILTNGGVLGRGAGHLAWFSSNINSRAAVAVRMNDGQWFKSHILGLAYHNTALNTNVLIAELRDTAPIVRSNLVEYLDCFDDVSADVRFRYSAAGVSQEIIFRGRPPSPEAVFGLPSATTHLLVISEVIEAPTPQIQERSIPSGPETLRDQAIDFGSMRLAQGQAFDINNTEPRHRIAVTKQFETVGNRRLIVERIPFRQVRAQLLNLPISGSLTNLSGSTSTNAATIKAARWFADGTLPPLAPKPVQAASIAVPQVQTLASLELVGMPSPASLEKHSVGALRGTVTKDGSSASLKPLAVGMPSSASPKNHFPATASAPSDPRPGFLLDWNLVQGGDGWFDSSYTYLIDGETHLSSAYFLGGTVVIKFEPYSSLYIDGPVWWYASDGILTSVDDESCGESIPHTEGNEWFGPYGPIVVDCDYLPVLVPAFQVFYAAFGICSSAPCVSTITVVATDPVATKGSADNGTFTITRVEGDWSQPLPVQFTMSGTAIAGTDFQSISVPVTIPAYCESTTVTVTPLAPLGTRNGGTAVLTLSEDSGYILGDALRATVFIYDPTAPPPPLAPVPSGLIAWWRGENNALDSAGTFNGELENGLGFASGQVGQAFNFDGVNDRLTVTTSGLNFGGNADFSIETWVLPSFRHFGEIQSIVEKRDAPASSDRALGYALFLSDGRLACQLADYPETAYNFSNFGPAGPDLRDGFFHHVALTLDRDSTTGGKLYVDGNVVLTFDPTVQPGDLSNSQPLRIGNHPNLNVDGYFSGIVDEVSIYNRALSPAEIQSIHWAGRGGKGVRPAISTQPQNQTLMEGGSATFIVVATGSPALTYQWSLNGQDIPAATASSFTAAQLQTADSGRVYTIRVSNAFGSVTSAGATTTVLQCDPAQRPLAFSSWKTSCEDKFYFDVTSLAGTLTGGRFDLFVYFDGVHRTFYRTLDPWGPSDVLANGGHHLFTFCGPDHSITNFDCSIVYQGGGTCAASPKFRIAGDRLALLKANTTKIRNPLYECVQPEVFDLIDPLPRPACPRGQDCGCDRWPVPPGYTQGGSAHLDNFYKVSDPPVLLNPACPKKGFKNVYAIKQWHGTFGPMAGFWGGIRGANGQGACQEPATFPTADSVKYRTVDAYGTTYGDYEYRGQHYPSAGGADRMSTVDRYTGKRSSIAAESGSTGGSRAVMEIVLNANRGNIIKFYEGLLPAPMTYPVPGGLQPVPVTYSGFGSSVRCDWDSSWDWMFSNDGTWLDCADDATIRHYGYKRGYVTCDLIACSVTAHAEVFEGFEITGCPGAEEENGWTLDTTDTVLNLREDLAEYSYLNVFTESKHEYDRSAYASGWAMYFDPYSTADLNADCDALLAQWDLFDDFQYPWRDGSDVTAGPLVTYNERSAALPSISIDLVNLGTPEDPNWQQPLDTSGVPWPSQDEGAVLGAPLPVHGPNGELYAYDRYFNFYHINWRWEETDVGHPQGFPKSYGALSPFPNATQWLDDDQTRVFPGGPFWAYGSSVESSDHMAFRLKSPYINDTDGEWEQGGYGAGCLIKCKWAESLDNAPPPGKDLVFKQWNFNFRDFIESYQSGAFAWYRNVVGDGCPPMAGCSPVRFTPITIDPGQPGAGYYIGAGSYWISQMSCSPIHYDYTCCHPAIYVQPNSTGPECTNGIFIAMPPAVCDERYGSLWMGRVDQSTTDAHACDNYVENRNNGIANPISCDPQIELDLIWHPDPRGGGAYETFVAPATFSFGGSAPALEVDLDIDSNNKNGLNLPDRNTEEDEIEDDPAKMGKIVGVNAGDADKDGIPDYADGFNLDGTIANDDDSSDSLRLVPIVLEMPQAVNLSAARLTVTYDASDPAGVTQDAEGTWHPAPGHLRMWLKNGDQPRKMNSANAPSIPGDFVAPGEYTPAQLGLSASKKVITAYLEGIAASESKADQRIAVQLRPGLGEAPVSEDAVRVTVIGTEVVEATGDTTVTPSSLLKDSHPAPYFEGLQITLDNPHPTADGSRLVASIQISGRIRSDLCDLTSGDSGKVGSFDGQNIEDILVSLNGEPLPAPTSISFTQPKSSHNASFTKPFATYTEFDLLFSEVDVSTGLNWLRLAASDKVPGSGLTGSAEFSWTVVAILDPAFTQLSAEDPYAGWIFQNSPVTLLSKSQGGEIHPYYVRFKGPKEVLAEIAAGHPERVAQGPDEEFYATSVDNTPEAHILVALHKLRPAPDPQGALDLLDEGLGYFYGIGAQALEDLKGGWQLAVLSAKLPYLRDKYVEAYVSVSLGSPTDQQIQYVVAVGTKAEQVSNASKAIWNLWLAAEGSQWSTLEAAAAADWDEAYNESETLRWMAAYMVELIVAINNEYAESSAFKRGEIKGRLTLEVGMIIIPLTEAAQLSKLALLTKLSEVQWVKENQQLLNIILRVIELTKGNRPTPPVIGLPASELPPLRVGSEIGGVGERLSGRISIKIAREGAAARRVKAMETLLSELPNAGERNVAARLKTYQHAVVDKCAEIPTREQYADVLRYSDLEALRTEKAVTHVLVADEEDIGLLTSIEGFMPDDWLIGHHWPPKYIQERFIELGVQIVNKDNCPVQILTAFEHAKGRPGSIHSLMSSGDFPEDIIRLRQIYQDKQTLMDAQLRFVKNSPNEDVKRFAKPLRAWAQELNIPFSE